MIKDISKLNDVERHAVYSLIRLAIAIIVAIASSIIGWVLFDTNAPNLHIIAWVIVGVFSGATLLLIMIYLRVVFK